MGTGTGDSEFNPTFERNGDNDGSLTLKPNPRYVIAAITIRAKIDMKIDIVDSRKRLEMKVGQNWPGESANGSSRQVGQPSRDERLASAVSNVRQALKVADELGLQMIGIALDEARQGLEDELKHHKPGDTEDYV